MLVEYCQSCGRLLRKQPDHGTEKDGVLSRSYCHKCYLNGSFTEPGLTRWQMIERLIPDRMERNNLSYIEALIDVNRLLSGLERWRSRRFWN